MSFIVFEGLDGSGKSSLIKSLEQTLQTQGISYVRTREPGGTRLGDEIRDLILRKNGPAPTPRTELLLYEASRSQHVDEVIRPSLAAKKWVLCDRYTASSLAFQGGGREISEWDVLQLNAFATDGLKAHVTVLLDLSVQESRVRRLGRGQEMGEEEDRIESEADSFHEKVRQSFLRQAEQDPNSWLILDARKSPQQLADDLLADLRSKKLLN